MQCLLLQPHAERQYRLVLSLHVQQALLLAGEQGHAYGYKCARKLFFCGQAAACLQKPFLPGSETIFARPPQVLLWHTMPWQYGSLP